MLGVRVLEEEVEGGGEQEEGRVCAEDEREAEGRACDLRRGERGGRCSRSLLGVVLVFVGSRCVGRGRGEGCFRPLPLSSLLAGVVVSMTLLFASFRF